MRLLQLDPRWLLKDGRRIGIVFLSPKRGGGAVHWRQTVFFEPTPYKVQCFAVWEAMADQRDETHEFSDWQPCRTDFAWTIVGGHDFSDISITPSIDGSRGGLWHGHITQGAVVGDL